MEFVLDALHQNSKIAKAESSGSSKVSYKDMIGSIFTRTEDDDDEEEEFI
jgi:hypothetical protein